MSLATDLIAKACEIEATIGTPFAQALREVITHNTRKIARRFTVTEIAEAADEVNDEHRGVLQAVAKAISERVRINKEEADMETLSTMVTLAKGGGADRFEKYEWYEAICARASEIRKVGETGAQARIRTMQDDADGKALYGAYREASGPTVRPEEPKPSPEVSPTLAKRDQIAQDLVAKGVMPTIEQARADVWRRHPELLKAYDTERDRGIKKALGR